MEKVKNTFAEIPVALIRLYQYLARPFVGYHCRFHPTCSTYAIEAFRQHGLMRGIFLTVKRLSRCHPFTEGGHDPVPLSEKKCQVS